MTALNQQYCWHYTLWSRKRWLEKLVTNPKRDEVKRKSFVEQEMVRDALGTS